MASSVGRNRAGTDLCSDEQPYYEFSSKFPSEDFMDLDEFISASGFNESVSENCFNSGTGSSCSVSRESSSGLVIASSCLKNSYKGTENNYSASFDNDSESNATDDSKLSDTESVTSKNKISGQKRRKSEPKYVYKPSPIFKKSTRKFIPDDSKDKKYWERRIKNNVAAKRSRDMRREKEMEIAELCKVLEEENTQLKEEILKLETKARELEQKVDMKS